MGRSKRFDALLSTTCASGGTARQTLRVGRVCGRSAASTRRQNSARAFFRFRIWVVQLAEKENRSEIERPLEQKRHSRIKETYRVQKNPSTGVNKQLIKVHVWSVALCGRETWVLNNAEQMFLECFGMRRRRTSVASELDSEKNRRKSTAAKSMKLGNLLDTIEEKKRNMMGRVLRHGDELLHIL
ncbi:Hypothetical protein CINCED_3A006727 [Cinara cedri]|uniref:Uncharacterized protein n=1 Tax=Cinara cedri TaxID=506608 RepID=A0A5E4M2E4_9HEMI|nr:Hypothetical protein CINCED_3A006727 [Cinara cedri]